MFEFISALCPLPHMNDWPAGSRDQSDYWTNLVDFGRPGEFLWMGSRQRLEDDDYSDWLEDNPTDNKGSCRVHSE